MFTIVSFAQFSANGTKPITNLSTASQPQVDSKGAPLLATTSSGAPASAAPSFLDNVVNKARDFSTGVAKGELDTATGIARLAQSVGQHVLAAVTPQTLKQVQSKYGFSSLQGPSADAIDELLKSSNNTEKAGKALEFLAELMFPVGEASKAVDASKVGTKSTEAVVDAIKTAENAAPAAAKTATAAAPETLGSLNDIAPKLAKKMADTSIPQAVKDKALEIFTRLDDKTKTALTRTDLPTFNKVLEQGKAALKDDAVTTPLENVGNQLKTALTKVSQKLDSAAVEKGNVLYKSALHTLPTKDIVPKAISKVEEIFGNMKLDSADSKFVDQFKSHLQDLTLSPEDQANRKLAKVAGETFTPTKTITPTLGDVDKTIDMLQDKLYKAKGDLLLPKTNRMLGPLRSVLGELNSGAKEIGGVDYAHRISEVSRLTNIKNALNKRLGVDGATAGSFVKRLFSPSDANTKKLMDVVGKETGQDFFRDSRLAKFVMDSLGDPRSKSLLESNNVPTSVSSASLKALKGAADYMVKKTGISDPIKAAEVFIKRYGGKDALNSSKFTAEVKPVSTFKSAADAIGNVVKKTSKAAVKRAADAISAAKNKADFDKGIPPF